MKKFIITLTAIFMCVTARAETFNQYWYVGTDSYATTQCTTGGDIILPTAPTKRGYTFAGWKKSSYVPIEYLESTGTQWIDTGHIPNQDTKFRVKLNMAAYVGGSIIGYANGSSDIYRLFNYNGKIYFDYGNDGSGRISGGEFSNDTTYDFIVGTRYVKNYETDTIIIGKFEYLFFQGTSSIEVFGTGKKGKIYLLQIWQNNILVRDFIPVLDSDGIPCMFDKVEGKFYYNAGTGDFVAGPVIGEL